MTADVEVVVPPELEPAKEAVAELAAAVMEAEQVDGAVVVAFVDEQTMTTLNGRYRGLDEPTDVLSFRYADDASVWPDGEAPTSGGEVAVCEPVVRMYATQDRADPGRLLGWTIIHGILHLAGYDHETDDGEMRLREQELLARLEPAVDALAAGVGA